MYLTILKPRANEQITFEQLLKNPFMYMESSSEMQKITLEITEDYGQQLYNKCPKHVRGILSLEDETENHYREFQIPKKSNPYKKRTINAPDDELKRIQTEYYYTLKDTYHILTHKAAHAYTEKRSVVTAMKEHQKNNSKWFLQIDLKDFFPSIKEDFLRRMLLQVYPFPFLQEEFFEGLIKHSLYKGSTPQGSVLSPMLTNLAMVPIDHEITERLKNYERHHFVYTRYADDITISCKQKFNEKEILEIVRRVFIKFNAPLKINDDKTHFGSSAGRNYHLGLIINKDNQLSVGHEKNQKFRAMLYDFGMNHETWDITEIQQMLGLMSYYISVEPRFVERTIKKYNAKFGYDLIAFAKSKLR